MYYFPGESHQKVEEFKDPAAAPDTKKLEVMRNTKEMIDYYAMLCDKYPIASIEDALDENDWDGWQELTSRLSGRGCCKIWIFHFATSSFYCQFLAERILVLGCACKFLLNAQKTPIFLGSPTLQFMKWMIFPRFIIRILLSNRERSLTYGKRSYIEKSS